MKNTTQRPMLPQMAMWLNWKGRNQKKLKHLNFCWSFARVFSGQVQANAESSREQLKHVMSVGLQLQARWEQTIKRSTDIRRA